MWSTCRVRRRVTRPAQTITISMSHVEELRAQYEAAGQSHVFSYWDKLSGGEKAHLERQLLGIDPAKLNDIVKHALIADEAARHEQAARVEPRPLVRSVYFCWLAVRAHVSDHRRPKDATTFNCRVARACFSFKPSESPSSRSWHRRMVPR